MLDSPTNYKPAVRPETPYLKAQQLWDERIGTNVVRAKNWRYAFFLQSVACLILGIALLLQIRQQKVIPIFVGVDKERGEPIVMGRADERHYQPGPLEIKYFLSQFIRFVRSVPADSVVIRQNWLRAYSFLRGEAAGLLNEQTSNDEESPLKRIGKEVVSVQPLSVVSIPGTNSYQVRWREEVYSANGMKSATYTMLGTFILEFEPPRDEQQIHENPLGLFIKTFQWNREL